MIKRKGIVLAGGSGKRLHPLTVSISKQLLPVYDKPMIYYPLSTLIMAGIRDILVICNPGEDILFNRLLGDGSQFGINISYMIQDKPEGIAQSLILGKDFLNNDPCALILGDNIFHGGGLEEILISVSSQSSGATVFAYEVNDPERYGVIDFDNSGKAISIIEKPIKPISKFAVTGLYFFDNKAYEIASSITPSPRGELEITDVNAEYLKINMLQVEVLGSGFVWLDAGTHDSLLESSQFIASLQKRQAINVACLEAIAYKKGFITNDQLRMTASKLGKSDYSDYLLKVAETNVIHS